MLPSTRPLMICCRKISIRGSPRRDHDRRPDGARDGGLKPGHVRIRDTNLTWAGSAPLAVGILGAVSCEGGRSYPVMAERHTIHSSLARGFFAASFNRRNSASLSPM